MYSFSIDDMHDRSQHSEPSNTVQCIREIWNKYSLYKELKSRSFWVRLYNVKSVFLY